MRWITRYLLKHMLTMSKKTETAVQSLHEKHLIRVPHNFDRK